jgi:hypothetical protein
MNERALTIKLPLSHTVGLEWRVYRAALRKERVKNWGVLNKENGIMWTNGKLHKIPEKNEFFQMANSIADTVHGVTARSVAVTSRGGWPINHLRLPAS